jgi:hypothetical protein
MKMFNKWFGKNKRKEQDSQQNLSDKIEPI